MIPHSENHKPCGAKSCDNDPNCRPINRPFDDFDDPALASLVEAWTELPKPIRAAILAMVKSAMGESP